MTKVPLSYRRLSSSHFFLRHRVFLCNTLCNDYCLCMKSFCLVCLYVSTANVDILLSLVIFISVTVPCSFFSDHPVGITNYAQKFWKMFAQISMVMHLLCTLFTVLVVITAHCSTAYFQETNFSLFMLKMPLNSNHPTHQSGFKEFLSSSAQ